MTQEHCLLYEAVLTTYLWGRVQCLSGYCEFKERHENNLRKNIDYHENSVPLLKKAINIGCN
jgi:hypothetical protein